ncbi:hypothetical protein H4I95_12179 [Botrytis cinerea]
MLALPCEPIPALDPRTCPTCAGNQLDSLYTAGRNTMGTSQPTGLNDSPNPTPHNLRADSVPGPGPAAAAAGSAGTGM